MYNNTTKRSGFLMSNGRNSGITSGLLLLGLSLAIGMGVATWIASETVERVKLANQTIRVKGYAEQKVTSDQAQWQGSFIARGDNIEEAYSIFNRDQERILAFFEKQGVKAEDINLSPVNTIVQYRRTEQGYETSVIESYRLERNFKISTTDLELIASLARDSATLLQEGIEINSYTPMYFYSKLEDLKISLLGKATRNARERARQLAEGSGSTAGTLRSASQGVFQITPPYSTAVDDYGLYDTSTIEKVVKAVVTMEYSIAN